MTANFLWNLCLTISEFSQINIHIMILININNSSSIQCNIDGILFDDQDYHVVVCAAWNFRGTIVSLWYIVVTLNCPSAIEGRKRADRTNAFSRNKRCRGRSLTRRHRCHRSWQACHCRPRANTHTIDRRPRSPHRPAHVSHSLSPESERTLPMPVAARSSARVVRPQCRQVLRSGYLRPPSPSTPSRRYYTALTISRLAQRQTRSATARRAHF